MTQEEKAKAYDKAYKVAESIHRFSSDPAEIKRMEEIFLELAKSDDERIRKQTLKVLNYYKDEEKSEGRMPTEIEECIAWLEKQGEQKPAYNVEPRFKIGDTITDPTDSIFTFHINAIKDGKYMESDKDWVLIKEADSDYELVEQKPAWSEEDENRFRNLIYLVEHSNEGKATKEGFIKFINRLKSLK